MYFVCQRARQDVKVALIGQGPDELFGGYKRHLGVHYGDTVAQAAERRSREAIGSASARLPRNETAQARCLRARHRTTGSPLRTCLLAGAGGTDRTDSSRRAAAERVDRDIVDGAPAAEMEHLDELASFQHLEIRSSLPDELLMFGVIAHRAAEGSDEHYALLAGCATVSQLRTAVKLEPRPETRYSARTAAVDHQERRRRVHLLADQTSAPRRGEVRRRTAVSSRCADRRVEARSRQSRPRNRS